MLIRFKKNMLIRCRTSSKQRYAPKSGEAILWSFPRHDCEVTTSLQRGSSTGPQIIKKSQTVTKTRKVWHEIDSVSFRSMLCCRF